MLSNERLYLGLKALGYVAWHDKVIEDWRDPEKVQVKADEVDQMLRRARESKERESARRRDRHARRPHLIDSHEEAMPHRAEPCNLKPRWAGQFTTFDMWVNKASGWIDKYAVCVDAKGRRCTMGMHFMRARDEGAFPVRFFWDCAPLPEKHR